MRAVNVRLPGTDRIRIRSAHDEQAAPVARRGWVGPLVEDDRVVLDVAIPHKSNVGDSSAVTGAQVAANPVVVELVVVGTGTESDAAGSCWSGREQFIALGRVLRDPVVVNIDKPVKAVRQLLVRVIADLARTRIRIDRSLY